jgi:hypothetical protein
MCTITLRRILITILFGRGQSTYGLIVISKQEMWDLYFTVCLRVTRVIKLGQCHGTRFQLTYPILILSVISPEHLPLVHSDLLVI